jgi:hypothetical protein
MQIKEVYMRKYNNTFYTMSGFVKTVYSYGRDKYIIIDNGKNSIPLFATQSTIDDISQKQKMFIFDNKELMIKVTYDQFYRICSYKTVETCDDENNNEYEYQCFDMQEDNWLRKI